MTVLEAARADIGYTEYPAGSNRTKYGKWFGMDGVPWCMEAVQYWFDAAGRTLPYKTASCSELLEWYKAHEAASVVKTPEPGDIAIYTFGHTGVVESAGDGTVTAIEGNTSAGQYGSQDNGGGVYRRKRSASLVRAYIRPSGGGEESEGEDEDMTGEQIVNALTDEQAYRLLTKAQQHAAALEEPAWSESEGHWARARENGTINGASPEGLMKRDEVIAVLGRKGLV